MVREKDACWEYGERLDGNKVKCKFCLRLLNGGISRLKYHLSRLPSKGVNPCSKVRDDVTDRVRAILALKEDGREILNPNGKKQKIENALSSPPSVSTSSFDDVLPSSSKVFPTSMALMMGRCPLLSDQEAAERCIALFFLENKLEFSAAHSSSYKEMIDAVKKCGTVFVGPSPESLRNALLTKIKTEVSLESKDAEKEWPFTGCTIIAETWTDSKNRALINFLVSSPSRTYFHKSVDASSYYKNTKFLPDLFDSVVQEIGQDNVVQIIVDTTLNCTGLVSHILQNYGSIFVSPCAWQCLNAILEEFSRVDWVNRCITQTQSISKFIYNTPLLLELMKKFTSGQDIIKSGLTKTVSDFLSLQCMLKQRPRLKHMFNSPEYTANSAYANKPQSLTCTSNLDDNDLWRAVDECVSLSEPFLKVMRELSGGKPAIGFIYELMNRAKESIRTYYIMDEIKCNTFLDIVDKNWHNNLHSPLHSAAAFLNPSIQYNVEPKFISLLKEDFFRVLEKMLPTPELRRDISNQILLFSRASGMFGCSLAKEAIETIPPGIWWEQYGDTAPTLQRVAIRILSQVCSTFSFVRNWSTFQQLHFEKRNKIDKENFNDLVYVQYNLKLQNLKGGRSILSQTSEGDQVQQVDALQLDDIDMSSEWVEECENPSPTQWLDRFGSALDVNDLNTRQLGASIFGATDHIFGL